MLVLLDNLLRKKRRKGMKYAKNQGVKTIKIRKGLDERNLKIWVGGKRYKKKVTAIHFNAFPESESRENSLLLVRPDAIVHKPFKAEKQGHDSYDALKFDVCIETHNYCIITADHKLSRNILVLHHTGNILPYEQVTVFQRPNEPISIALYLKTERGKLRRARLVSSARNDRNKVLPS
jgi:hypothetical protein